MLAHHVHDVYGRLHLLDEVHAACFIIDQRGAGSHGQNLPNFETPVSDVGSNEAMLRVLVFCFIATALFGQSPEVAGSGGFIRELIAPYRPHPVSRVSFEDSPRLDKLMRAGQIYLSLRDAIALALENNLDIEYARLNPKLSEANLLRAKAGQLLRNVSNSITTGPSSATLGVLAGANSLGTTGQGSSSGGQGGVLSGLNVQLAGSSIPNLDPTLYGLWQFAHTTTPKAQRSLQVQISWSRNIMPPRPAFKKDS